MADNLKQDSISSWLEENGLEATRSGDVPYAIISIKDKETKNEVVSFKGIELAGKQPTEMLDYIKSVLPSKYGESHTKTE